MPIHIIIINGLHASERTEQQRCGESEVAARTALHFVLEHEVQDGLAGLRHVPVDVVDVAAARVAQQTHLDLLRHRHVQPCDR